jgi:glutathione transport system permease protein
VVVYFTLRIGTAIITASSLSFLGMGAPVEMPEWGAMLSRARDFLGTAPHYAIAPSLAIFVTVLAFNILGDGLRDAIDPKLDRR